MIIGQSNDRNRWVVQCNKCKQVKSYAVKQRAEINSKKCLFCRRDKPTSKFGNWYRDNLLKPTKSFKKWKQTNVDGMRMVQGVKNPYNER